MKLSTELLRDGNPDPVKDCRESCKFLGEAMVVCDGLEESHPVLHGVLGWVLNRHGAAYAKVFAPAPAVPPTPLLHQELEGRVLEARWIR